MTPKISVVMSVYNAEKYLRESIESILNQSFTDFEFIVVDDGSTDNSPELIKGYEDARIRVISNEENIGLTESLNEAIKAASGEYIARQDADDVSLQNRFEEQLKYLDNHPNVALLGTSVYLVDENGEMMGKRIASPSPKKSLFRCNRFYHGSLMFRKSTTNELGAYNPLFKYSQDYELILRISQKYDVRNLKSPLYKMRFHSSSISSTKIEEQQIYAVMAQKFVKGEDKFGRKLLERSRSDLYKILNESEKVLFHKLVAYNHVQNGNIRLARDEYFKTLKLKSFDIENLLHVLFSFFGTNGIKTLEQTYRLLRFVLHKLFNIDI
ncbi:hypothetical protein DRN85_05850 [Methanosarcinales archaeon]|nr:MAG: hypothetical protein DRN85_05850 [Methanosarcinales archaeon]